MLKHLYLGENFIIPSYNLFVSIGIASAMLFLQYNKGFKQKKENEKFKIHFCLLISIICGFIGAFVFDAFSKDIALTFDNLHKIGLTFFGGFISALFILIISIKLFSFNVLATLNILTRPFCIAHFFGRIGCFMAGCCYGNPTNSIFGVVFPVGSLPYNQYHQLIKLHPTQLYESFFILILFLYSMPVSSLIYISILE